MKMINTLFLVLFMFDFSYGQVEKKVGETFEVKIMLENFEDFYGSNLYLDYDTTYVEPLLNTSYQPDFVEGGFFEGNSSSTMVSFVSNTAQINIGASLLGGSQGIDGSGVLCILYFKTKKSGSTELNISGVVKDFDNIDHTDVQFEKGFLNIKPLEKIYILIE